MNFEQFFDDVISGHNDIIGYWFFTASKVLGWSLIILKNWGHSTYQYYVTFSESDPSFRFSQMKKSWKMNLFDRSNPCFRVSRYRWIRWWYQIFDILNIGTFRFLKLKGPIILFWRPIPHMMDGPSAGGRLLQLRPAYEIQISFYF